MEWRTDGDAPGFRVEALHVERTVRKLNIFGVAALVALAFYVGWAS
jgi:hypothetical protein